MMATIQMLGCYDKSDWNAYIIQNLKMMNNKSKNCKTFCYKNEEEEGFKSIEYFLPAFSCKTDTILIFTNHCSSTLQIYWLLRSKYLNQNWKNNKDMCCQLAVERGIYFCLLVSLFLILCGFWSICVVTSLFSTCVLYRRACGFWKIVALNCGTA